MDVPFEVDVVEDGEAPPAAAQPDNPDAQTLTAYAKLGTGFVAPGLALAWAMHPAHSLVLDVRSMLLLPSFGVTLSPALSYELGF